MKKLSGFQKINILQLVTCIIVVGIMLWINYKQPAKFVSDAALTKEMRAANAEQRAARIKQLEEAEKNTAYFQKRDSINDIKMDNNNDAMNKFKKESNEKINSIRVYNSAELVRAFAELGKAK